MARLGPIPVTLSRSAPILRSPQVAVDPLTSELVVTIKRTTTLDPINWTGTVRVSVVLFVDGAEHRATGQATGGVRLGLDGEELTEYVLRYAPTYFLGDDGRAYIEAQPKDAGGFVDNVPTTRIGEKGTDVRGYLELELLDGDFESEVTIESFSAPAPRIRAKNSVAFDAATGATENAGDGVLSVSHTSTGSDLGGFVGNGNVRGAGGSLTTSVSWAGSGMTERWDVVRGTEANSGYTIAGQTSGAQTVTATLVDTDPLWQALGVISMTGVDQTTPVGTAVTAQGDGVGGSATPSVTVASVGTDDMVVDNIWYSWVADASAGAGQTQRYNTDYATQRFSRGSTQSGVDGGVMSWTGGSMNDWILGAIAFKPLITSPAAPTITSQAGGHTRAGVQWTAGADGGSPVTDWDIDAATAAAPTTWLGVQATGSTLPYGAYTGLTNGTAYVFRVRGVNAIGDGVWSATSGSATPSDVRGFFLLEDGTSKFLLENGTDKFLLEAGAATAGSFTGTVAVTLAAFVSAASGTYAPPPITGTVAVTLAAFVSAASGTRSLPAITGTVATTLAAFTSTASGTSTPPAFTGTSATTLGTFVSAVSGTVTAPPISGTATVTLAAFASAASGTTTPPTFTGTSATTLAPFTSSASGTSTAPTFTGTVAVTLAAFTTSTAGTTTSPSITGTVAVTLGAFTSSATGSSAPPAITGTVAVTLGAFTATATGTRTLPAITGSVAVTLAAFTSAASGTVAGPGAIVGTAAVTLAPFTSTASGTRSIPAVTGTSATTLATFVPAASGTVAAPGITGTATPTLAAFVAAGSGIATPPTYTGTAAVTLGPFTAIGTGTAGLSPITGTVAVTLGAFIALAYEIVPPLTLLRMLTVAYENRLAAVAAEPRTLIVVAEDRTDHVPPAERELVPVADNRHLLVESP